MEDPSPGQIPSWQCHPGGQGTAGDTTHPKDSQGTSPQNPHSQKKKKNQKNGDRLVFLIQRFLSLFKPGLSTAQCQTHQNLFVLFCLREAGEGSSEPALPTRPCTAAAPALAQLRPPEQTAKYTQQVSVNSQSFGTLRPSAAVEEGGREGLQLFPRLRQRSRKPCFKLKNKPAYIVENFS